MRSAQKGGERVKTEVAAFYTEEGTQEEWRQLYMLLSEERKSKADGIRFPEKRRQSLAAGALLEYLLKKNGINGPYRYGATAWGRPFLLSFSGKNMEENGLYFSLSHTQELAVCVLSQEPVGVDAEYIRGGREKIARRYFLPEEQRELETGDAQETFFRIWTKKEAWAKLEDRPLLEILRVREGFDGFVRSFRRKQHIITVCSRMGEGAKKVDFIGMEELLSGLSKTF